MKIGIDLDGRIPLADMIEMTRIADEAGFHSVWADEHLGDREAVAASMAFLAATRNVTVIPTALSPYVAHPLFWAMGVATLAEYAPGRVALCAGTSNPNVMAEMGLSVRKPLASMRDMIAASRKLWEAKTGRIDFHGETLDLNGAHIGFEVPGKIPIYLAAIGPKMCELSGEAADGVVLSAGVSTQYIEWALERVEKGRKKGARADQDFTVAGLIATTVSENYEEALSASQTALGYLLRSPALKPSHKLSGAKLDLDAINDALVREDWEAMRRLIPEKVVHAHSVTGTPDAAIERIAEYTKSGLEIPVLALRGSAEARKKALCLLAQKLVSG
ncbi:MAG: LLM class flavin-dependent oxidoreductase [Nitrospinota bacterium]